MASYPYVCVQGMSDLAAHFLTVFHDPVVAALACDALISRMAVIACHLPPTCALLK